MPINNRCMYMVHVWFYVCCSDCVGVCGNGCCVADVVEDSGFISTASSTSTIAAV